MGQSTDLLVIILIVAIVAVVLDGLRRKWRDRQDRVVVKLDRNFLRSGGEAADDVLTTSELPNGGARTLARTGDTPAPRKPGPKLKNGKHRGQEDAAAPATERAKGETVPVLMDTVDVEETDIEHANVFVSTEPSQQFTPEEFDDEPSPARVRSNSNVVEDKDMLDAQVEGLELRRDPLAPQAGRKSDYDDEDEFEDEEFEEEEDEEDDEDEFEDEEDDEDEFEDDDWEDEDEDEEDEEGYPRRRRRVGDDDEDEEWEDDEDEDEDEDDGDDEDEEEEDDEDEDEDDDWGEDEDENYSADYENEPALLEETYTRAASHFARPPAEPPQARIEPGFGEGEPALGDLNEEELLAESFSENFTEAFEDEGLFTEGLEDFKAEPVTAAAVPEQAEKAEKTAAKATEKAAEAKEPARDAAKDAKDKRSFFSKSLLARQQQVELFQEDMPQAEEESSAPVAENTGPREVLIINVMARPGYSFHGADLLAVVRQQGLQLGEMSIFHRHEQKDGSGRVLFSMANMVKPGTFDLATMDEFATPGVSLFLQLPCKYGNMAAFDLMLGTALALREQLDGELKDEQRSVFTRQTIEHVRQRIRDFELSLLSRR
jgi:cell division protein ZipA